jgi:hypothetical protein
MRKPFVVAISLLLVLGNVLPISQPTFTNAAPPPPVLQTPTSPIPEAVATAQPPHTPPSPGKLPLAVERMHAQQAVQAVLDKYLRYWGPRYQVAPAEVSIEGEWAHGVAPWRGQTRTLKEPIHILAHRSPDGTWQALMPGSDELYLKWLEVVPERLVPASEKSQLRAQVAEANSLPWPSAQSTAVPTPTPNDYAVIERLIQQAVAKHNDVLAFLIFDVLAQIIGITSDGNWATAQLVFVDKQTSEVLPTEPGMALAQRDKNGWKVVLQADPEWNNWLDAVPVDLMTPEAKESWATRSVSRRSIGVLSTFSGYKLPWPAVSPSDLFDSDPACSG